jgi:hypothetical protein
MMNVTVYSNEHIHLKSNITAYGLNTVLHYIDNSHFCIRTAMEWTYVLRASPRYIKILFMLEKKWYQITEFQIFHEKC